MHYSGIARLDSPRATEARRVSVVMVHYVYILVSLKDGKTYTGMTQNVGKRLQEHNAGRHVYTKLHCPWKVLHVEEFSTLAFARKRERYYKSAAGRKRIVKIYSGIV